MSSSLRSQVQVDLDQIARLRADYADVLATSEAEEPPHRTVLVAAVALHGFYNGAENALKRILLEVDGSVPSGESSHSDLLKLATATSHSRPSIINDDLRIQLLPFMTFRHFFRHAYGFQLEWVHLRSLIQKWPQVADMLSAELLGFLDWFESKPDISPLTPQEPL